MTSLGIDTRPGIDAWSWEAGRVRDLATCLGLTLDEEELVLRDVHDLQALRASLRPTGPTRRHVALARQRWAPPGDRPRVGRRAE